MRLFSLFSKSAAVYFPDATTFYKHKEGYETYKKIFTHLDIPFQELETNLSSGVEVFVEGYEQLARRIANDNYHALQKKGIKKIITTSPECYYMLSQVYPTLVPQWDIVVDNIWAIILEHLEKRPQKIKYPLNETLTFHDNCYLGRYAKIYDEPRKIVQCIGCSIKEMDNNRGKSFCCGSCGGLPLIDKQTADNLAKERLMQAKRIGIQKMVVTSFDNYQLLIEHAAATGIEVLELSQVLAQALRIKLTSVHSTANKEINNKQNTLVTMSQEIIQGESDE
ncbi:MAG: (Fe-S)-binding protein [Nanoarchaeota archaeon]